MSDDPKKPANPANPPTPEEKRARAAAARDRIRAELLADQEDQVTPAKPAANPDLAARIAALKASVARDRWYFEHGEQPPDFEEAQEPDEVINDNVDHELEAWLADLAEQSKRAEEEYWRRRSEENKPNGKHPDGELPPDNEALKPLQGISAAKLKGKQQARQFLDHAEIYPLRNVALVAGDGAIGKSLLILQLGIACTTDTQWLGVDVMQGPVVYISCEDEAQEIANRLNEICEAEGIDLAAAKDLHIFDLTGKDGVLAEATSKDGKLKPLPMIERLRLTMEEIKPVLLVLDGLADVFAGNENNRGHAKQFVTMLRGLAIPFNCVVMLINHPSLSGISSGTGMSGSTGWNNAVRARSYFHKPDGPDTDADERIFEVMKANYAASGVIRWELKWNKGRFVRTQIKSAFTRITVEDVDRVKIKFGTGRFRVNEQSDEWGGYAVADLFGWDIGRGITAKLRTNEQTKNRTDIRQYLAAWVQNKVIFVVSGLTAKREPTSFYSHKPN